MALLFSGTAQLLTGYGAVQVLGLARNFAVAKLLGPEDFGVAATFAVTLSILEMASDLGADKLLAQSQDGEDSRLQATLHAMLLLRGAIVACALLALADPVSRVFGVPHAAPAYAWLAVVPLLRGLAHSDVKRLHRQLSFRRDVATVAIAQVAALLVATSLAFALQSYWAMLWGVVAHAAAQAVASHWLAERRYRVGFDREMARKAFAFGWPLTLNGALLVALLQGDRAVIGAMLGPLELGVYALVALIVQSIAGTALLVMSGVGLPWISAAQHDIGEARRRHGLLGAAWSLVLTLIFPPLMLLGDDVVTFVFGEAYRPGHGLVALVALVGLLRFWRGWLSTVAVAFGRTRLVLVANVALLSGLGLGVCAAMAGLGTAGVAGAIALGEIAGIGALVISLRYCGLGGFLAHARPVFLQLGVCCLLVIMSAFLTTTFLERTYLATAVVLVLLATIVGASASGRQVVLGGWRWIDVRRWRAPS